MKNQLMMLCIAAAACQTERIDTQRSALAEQGLAIERQDTEVRPGEPMVFAGSYVGRDGLAIRFDSELTGDRDGFAIVTTLDVGGTVFEVRFDNWPGHSDLDHARITLHNLSGAPAPKGATTTLGDFAAKLQELYPPQDTTRDGYQGSAAVVYPHWIAVRDYARLLTRWTLVGLDAADDTSGGPEPECDVDESGKVVCKKPWKGSGGSSIPGPTAGCAFAPSDTLQPINCCAPIGQTTLHLSEHDANHCVQTFADKCGTFVEPDPSGQPITICTGRCGIPSGSSNRLLCFPILTAGVPMQDCLDADTCILAHAANMGAGAGFCANEVFQATDDELQQYGIEVLWTIAEFGLPFGIGFIVETVVQKAEECSIPDPAVSSGPATPRL